MGEVPQIKASEDESPNPVFPLKKTPICSWVEFKEEQSIVPVKWFHFKPLLWGVCSGFVRSLLPVAAAHERLGSGQA